MTENTLIPIETRSIIEKAIEFLDSIKDIIEFNNEEGFAKGLDLCKLAKELLNKIEDKRKEIVKPFNNDVKAINKECDTVTDKLKNFENVFKSAAKKLYMKNEIARKEQQQKLEIEAEVKRVQHRNAAKREMDKFNQYMNDGKFELAENAKRRADRELNLSKSIVAAIVTNPTKIKGITFSPKHAIIINDNEVCIKSCVEKGLLHLIKLDESAITKKVNSDNGKCGIDGIVVVDDVQISVRA